MSGLHSESRRVTSIAPIGGVWQNLRRLLCRPVWLPRALYAAIPGIYLTAGTASLLGGLYLPDGAWLLPCLFLIGLGCVHAGILVASLRHQQAAPRPPDAQFRPADMR